MRGKRLLAPLLAFVTLAVPASASAHPKSATVALDYRLVLDHATRALPNVTVRILDGDRSLRVGVRHGRLVVLGDLGEQMLRIDTTGTWVNEASVTAQAARLTKSRDGLAPHRRLDVHMARPSPRATAVRRRANWDGRAVRDPGHVER